MDEFYGDSAYTFEVGEVSQEIKKLLRITKESLDLAVEQTRSGNRIGDIGFAVQIMLNQMVMQCCKRALWSWIRKIIARKTRSSKLWKKRKGTQDETWTSFSY